MESLLLMVTLLSMFLIMESFEAVEIVSSYSQRCFVCFEIEFTDFFLSAFNFMPVVVIDFALVLNN